MVQISWSVGQKLPASVWEEMLPLTLRNAHCKLCSQKYVWSSCYIATLVCKLWRKSMKAFRKYSTLCLMIAMTKTEKKPNSLNCIGLQQLINLSYFWSHGRSLCVLCKYFLCVIRLVCINFNIIFSVMSVVVYTFRIQVNFRRLLAFGEWETVDCRELQTVNWPSRHRLWPYWWNVITTLYQPGTVEQNWYVK